MKATLLLIVVVAALVGCGDSSKPLPDSSASVPRPAPGTETKDVMIPSAKTGQ